MDRPQTSREWAILFERQIILESLRDAPPDQELAALDRLLDESAAPNPQSAFPNPREIVTLSRDWWGAREDADTTESLERALIDEQLRWIECLRRSDPDTCCQRLEQVVAPEYLFQRMDGQRRQSNTETRHWGMWFPGLDNAGVTLQAVRDSLPGLPETAIPEEIRELENPTSQRALPGAVSLAWHDILHILLGRGLLDQDEAFVLGFTMGNASRYQDAHGDEMMQALAHLYPEPFRIRGPKLQAFALGAEAGRRLGVRDLADRENEVAFHRTLGELRTQLGIDTEELKRIYLREQQLIPKTLESARLNTAAT
jgi:hypothetical protein